MAVKINFSALPNEVRAALDFLDFTTRHKIGDKQLILDKIAEQKVTAKKIMLRSSGKLHENDSKEYYIRLCHLSDFITKYIYVTSPN